MENEEMEKAERIKAEADLIADAYNAGYKAREDFESDILKNNWKKVWEIIERHETIEKHLFGKFSYQVLFVLKNIQTGEIKTESFLLRQYNSRYSDFYEKEVKNGISK